MTDPKSISECDDTLTGTQTGLHAMHTSLDSPAPQNLADELAQLSSDLDSLRACTANESLHSKVLARIYGRAVTIVETFTPSLATISLPPPKTLRQIVHSLRELLLGIAELLVPANEQEPTTPRKPLNESDTALWQSLHALSCHLLISDLAATPPTPGAWRLLHTIYGTVRDRGVEKAHPEGASTPLRNLYFATVLLASAQPASFSPSETHFVANYLLQHVSLVRLVKDTDEMSDTDWWIDSSSDACATPCFRKTPPSDSQLTYFNCDRLAALIKKQLAALNSGIPPERIGLANFAITTAGRGALRRLAELLGNPGKRRFPRRRQHYRVLLCGGLENLWQLFSQGEGAEIETSRWMITNESPDGYSIMHVLGRTSDISVGGIVAVRTEISDKWQICIARWAQSHNPEHVEFGLQILATRAIPAMLALTKGSGAGQTLQKQQPVLILPNVPPLRSDEMLIAQSGVLEEQPKQLVLVIEQGNLEVREVRNSRLNEQNGLIEIFTIEPDSPPLQADAATNMEQAR